MTLLLYELLHSPYCIPVTRILDAFGVDFERVETSSWDRREIARVTGGSYYQVPVLVHGDTVVHETPEDPLAVARYLDRTFCGGRLFPAQWSGLQEIVTAHIEGELEGYSFKLCDIHYLAAIEDDGERTMVIRHKERAFGVGCVDQWRENEPTLQAAFARLLDRFDQRLRHAPFLFGDTPLYTDFALFGVLGNFTYRGCNDLPPSCPDLAGWHSRMAAYHAPQAS